MSTARSGRTCSPSDVWLSRPAQRHAGWTGRRQSFWSRLGGRAGALAGQEHLAAGVVRAREAQVVLGDDGPEDLDRAAGGGGVLGDPVAEVDDTVAEHAIRVPVQDRDRADPVD